MKNTLLNSLEVFDNKGVLLFPNFLSKNVVDEIKNEIHPWLDEITFNAHLSSSVLGNNQWIEHLGICSVTALESLLDENIISFAEKYFQEEVVLGSFEYQKKIIAEKEGLSLHCDHGAGLYIFIYLNEVSTKTGATRFYEKTHRTEALKDEISSEGVTKELYILENSASAKNKEQLVASGGPGTVIIWDRKTWHDLPGFTEPGRELIMASFMPKSQLSLARDHLFKKTFLSKLSKKQLSVCIFPNAQTPAKTLTKTGNDDSLLDDYKISKRMIFYFFRFTLLKVLKKLKIKN
jgi:hypothetical protein